MDALKEDYNYLKSEPWQTAPVLYLQSLPHISDPVGNTNPLPLCSIKFQLFPVAYVLPFFILAIGYSFYDYINFNTTMVEFFMI